MKDIFFYVLLVMIFSIISCNKNDNNSSPYLIEYSVEDNYISEGENVYLWVTDVNDEIIHFEKLEKNKSSNIPKPNDYNDQRISLHLLKVKPTYIYLYSYSDIKPGRINFKYEDFFYAGNKIGTAKMSFNSLPFYNEYTFSSSYGLFSIGTILQSKEVNIHDNSNDAYIYFKNGETGYYKYLQNLKAGDDLYISGSDFGFDMTKHYLNLKAGEKIDRIYLYQYKNKYDYTGRNIGLYDNYYSPDKGFSSFVFHTPELNNWSDSYRTYISFKDINGRNNYYTKFGEIPDKVEYIDADFESNDFSYNNLYMGTSGKFDCMRFYFYRNINSKYYYWYHYSENGENIRFPKIPTQISEMIPELTSSNLLTNSSSKYLYLIDYNNLNSYDQFIERTFYRQGKGILYGINSVKEIRY